MATSDKKTKVDAKASKSKSGSAGSRDKEAKEEAKVKAAPPPPPEPKGAAAAPKRKLGIKGAAPWAARHAAKHAAEARARAAEPAPPGSARATIRTPEGADEIKERLNELFKFTTQIRTLCKNVGKNFFEIGGLLREVQQRKLYESRGFNTFDNFVERETDLGKERGLKITRIAQVFSKEGATELGLERLERLLGTLDPSKESASDGKIAVAPPVRPPNPSRVVEPSGRGF